ncbi:MAG: nucleotidyltransferase family protein [Candidatus Obscuribacterales bacterium]|nr:nucleotidyltransferase family protein [Candidatus Obscuribacterales bacterium]
MLILKLKPEDHITLLTLSPLRRQLQQKKFIELFSEQVDWDRLDYLITRNRLLALFLFHTERFGLKEKVPRDFIQKCVSKLKLNRLMHKSLMQDALRFNDLMKGVPQIVFKGARMAATIYPDSGLREMDDIDVLVPHEKRALAADCMNEMGYLPSIVKKEKGLVPLSPDFVEKADIGHYELVHRHRAVRLEEGSDKYGIIGMDVHSDVLHGGLKDLLWKNTLDFNYEGKPMLGLANTLEFLIIAHRLYLMTMRLKRPYRLNFFADLWWMADNEDNNLDWSLLVKLAHERLLYPELFYCLYHLRHLGACKIPDEVLVELSPFDKYQYEDDLATKRFIDYGDFLPKALNVPRMVEVESFI